MRFHQVAHADVVQHGVFAKLRAIAERGAVRNRSFIAAAPSSNRTMSMPRIDAGNSPTAVKIENRPPTPSGISKTSLQPSRLGQVEQIARSRPSPARHAVPTNSRSSPSDSRSRARKMRNATAVSSVPPLLLITTIAQRSSCHRPVGRHSCLPCASAVSQQVQQPLRGVVVDVVPLKVHPRFAAALAPRKLVVVRVAAGLHQGPRPHVRPADAQHHHAIDRVAQPRRRRQDAAQLARRVGPACTPPSSRSGSSIKPASSGCFSGGTGPLCASTIRRRPASPRAASSRGDNSARSDRRIPCSSMNTPDGS